VPAELAAVQAPGRQLHANTIVHEHWQELLSHTDSLSFGCEPAPAVQGFGIDPVRHRNLGQLWGPELTKL
jgi:hypothetical protein